MILNILRKNECPIGHKLKYCIFIYSEKEEVPEESTKNVLAVSFSSFRHLEFGIPFSSLNFLCPLIS